MKEIGRLRTLRRYPIKSFRGEDLRSALVTFAGVTGDRVYAFIDPASTSTFPWVTARQIPEMILFEPRFLEPPSAEKPHPDLTAFEVEVTTPEGEVWNAGDPKFVPTLEARWQRPLKFRFSEKGMQDSRPILIFGGATVKRLETETGLTLDENRFRANFYVDWNDPTPFFEDGLVGKTLQIGEKLRVYVVKKNTRCTIIDLDPATAQPSPALLKAVGKNHAGCAGIYAATLVEGTATAGDPVYEIS